MLRLFLHHLLSQSGCSKSTFGEGETKYPKQVFYLTQPYIPKHRDVCHCLCDNFQAARRTAGRGGAPLFLGPPENRRLPYRSFHGNPSLPVAVWSPRCAAHAVWFWPRRPPFTEKVPSRQEDAEPMFAGRFSTLVSRGPNAGSKWQAQTLLLDE